MTNSAEQKIILGGDFNASIQIDEEYGNKYTKNAHKILFDRVEDFKLLNCFKPFYKGPVQTHRHPNSDFPWQNDYFFISETLSGNLKKCEVIDNDEIRKYSDHNPVIIELEI